MAWRTCTLFSVLLSLSLFHCSSNSVENSNAINTKCRKNAGDVYPDGPCGGEVGQVLPNFALLGKRAGINSSQEQIQLQELYDPKGQKGHKYLALNVSAVWCLACKQEATELPELQQQYGSKGVIFMTILAEDAEGHPATLEHVDAWLRSYKLSTIVVNDQEGSFAPYYDRNTMPLNLLVDLKTMKIIKRVTGADFQSIKTELDNLLK